MLFRRRKNVNLREMKLAHINYLGLNARRPVFGVYDHARLKPTCSVTESFVCSKFINYTYKRENNKGTDQTARMCRRVCAFNLRMQPRQVFSRNSLISMITVIIIIALFFNVFTPWLGQSMDDTRNERY